MNTTEYCVQIALVLLVLRQMRGGKLDLVSLVLPVVLIGATAVIYLKSVPTAGGDLALEIGLAALGVLLGTLAGLTTRVWSTREGAFAKAGLLAAALWVGGIGARIAFVLASEHTGFGQQVAGFSRNQHITSQQAWVAAFVLMALGEAVSRLLTIRIRALRLRPARTPMPV
ncbi:hypothetical protein ABH930_006647 [Kitasatospora sp. GAS204A]|uniref:hypothetical protein n=1 Tax=unclassified Kitasatospora TaxID=2633591 RepID=UPI00247707FB|nr:hypothetical protein [Kitasatospora sp. GAS204B]MDH6121154.1 hypothetical protein [Kitasatospora sp. GAS204B]